MISLEILTNGAINRVYISYEMEKKTQKHETIFRRFHNAAHLDNEIRIIWIFMITSSAGLGTFYCNK